MLTLTVNAFGDIQLARGIERFTEGIQDFRPAFEEMRLDFFQIEAEQFSTQGGRSGHPWAALSPDYAAWKAKHYPGMPILQLSGLLLSQLTGVGLQVDMQPMYMHLKPMAPYGKYHQTGTTRMPARQPVVMTEDDKSRWVKMLHRYVYNKAKEAGLA